MVSRREFGHLSRLVEQMDQNGTRGGTRLAEQVQQMARDLAQTRADGQDWREAHNALHKEEIQDRTSRTHWRVGTVIAALAVCGTFAGLLIDIAVRVHGIG